MEVVRIATDTFGTAGIPARPLIPVVGLHSQGPALAQEALAAVLDRVTGVALLVTLLAAYTDGTRKVQWLLRLIEEQRQADREVLGLRMAGMAVPAYAAGATGVSGGLGDAENFRLNDFARQGASASTPVNPRGTPRDVKALRRSLSGRDWARIERIPAALGDCLCDTDCCAAFTVEGRAQRSREHSLHERVAESNDLVGLPREARKERAARRLEAAMACGERVNRALSEKAQQPLRLDHLREHLRAVERLS